jgi:hypothetical protein
MRTGADLDGTALGMKDGEIGQEGTQEGTRGDKKK